MSKKGKKPSGKKFRHNKVDYVGTFKNGTLTIKSQRTAPGNKMTRGVFTAKNGHWDDDGIPEKVKDYYKKLYETNC